VLGGDSCEKKEETGGVPIGHKESRRFWELEKKKKKLGENHFRKSEELGCGTGGYTTTGGGQKNSIRGNRRGAAAVKKSQGGVNWVSKVRGMTVMGKNKFNCLIAGSKKKKAWFARERWQGEGRLMQGRTTRGGGVYGRGGGGTVERGPEKHVMGTDIVDESIGGTGGEQKEGCRLTFIKQQVKSGWPGKREGKGGGTRRGGGKTARGEI